MLQILLRNKKSGWDAITKYLMALEKFHSKHVVCYGDGLADRLTGEHETCDIDTFRSGSCDRGASIRIPHSVVQNRCGYVEDRRPGANCDPYVVAKLLVETFLYSEKISTADAVAKKQAISEAVVAE